MQELLREKRNKNKIQSIKKLLVVVKRVITANQISEIFFKISCVKNEAQY